MKGRFTASFGALSLAGGALVSPVAPHSDILSFVKPLSVTSDSVHNVHVGYGDGDFEGEVRLAYGDCGMKAHHERHHDVASHYINRSTRPERFVWIVPEDAFSGGCLHAYSGQELIGRSTPISVTHQPKKRREISEVADAMGPWFDGVAYMQSKQNNATYIAQAKSKQIAIVGGGMAGLLTSLLLDSVGVHDWHIIESSDRIGGRVRTKYLANSTPDEYQYQEMGPMRFPVSAFYEEFNETVEIQDHKMVFQLGDVLNQMNGGDESVAVNFIPWIQSSPNTPGNSNGFRLPNGRIPSIAQIQANSTEYTLPSVEGPDEEAVEAAEGALEEFTGTSPETLRNISSNMYQAHKDYVENGYFHFSEAAYLRYALNASDDVIDYVTGNGNSPIWEYDAAYFNADKWLTIDKGLDSLPRAFYPLIKERLTLGRKITGLKYDNDNDKICVQWRDDPFAMEPQSEKFDYAVVSAPFSKVRLWDLPKYSSLLSRAIASLNYQQSCKVSLHYKTRFWEHLSPPIIGGCGSTDIPGIGSVCYPAYEINSTGPGVLLASYSSGTAARSLAALSETDHVAMVQRAMVEVHGDIAQKQWTGEYDRQCWEIDEHQAGAWASPYIGQQDLYLPSYYNTEFKSIFIGEHSIYPLSHFCLRVDDASH